MGAHIEIPDDATVLICGPTNHVFGSMAITTSCGHDAFIAPTGMAALETASVPLTLCVPCAVDHPQVGKARMSVALTAAQRAELSGILGVAWVDQFMARYDITEREPT